jgi:probable HAF family extracellular repeat protein
VAINDRGQIVGNSVTASGVIHAFIWQHGRLRDLGTLFGKETRAVAINDRGQVVGYSNTGVNDDGHAMAHAFLWQQGHMKDLGTLGGDYSYPSALNDRGQVIGWSGTVIGASGDFDPFLWQDGRMADLGPRQADSAPIDINNAGQVVGAVGLVAVLWEHGRRVTVAKPKSDSGNAAAVLINDRGEVVVKSFHASSAHKLSGLVWHDGILTTLPTTRADAFSGVTAINSAGAIVGTCMTPNGRARPCLWADGTIHDLGTRSGDRGTALDINDRGEVVGHVAAGATTHGFIWRNGRMTLLPGLHPRDSTNAVAINAHGQIVGTSHEGTNQLAHAVLWTRRLSG